MSYEQWLWLAFGGAFAAGALTSSACWLLWFRDEPQRPTAEKRDETTTGRLEQCHAAATWHRERMEALAEECVDLLGYHDRRETIEAEICREIVYDGRCVVDAVERLIEIAGVRQ